MKNWKRILAALLALAMLFSMAAISEEQIVPEAAGEQAQVEERGEDGLTEEAAAEAAGETEGEEAAEESAGDQQEPVEDEPADATPAAPEVVIAPEWEYDAEIGAITIPYEELPETLTFEWNFDGAAAQYAVQTAPVPEGDNPEVRCERIYTTEPYIELPATDFAEGGWFSLYVTAILADGTEIEVWKYFRLEQQLQTEDYAVQQFNMTECEEYGHEWGWDEKTGDGTGICEVCGYRCPHKKTFTYISDNFDFDNPKDAVPYDNNSHVYFCDYYLMKECEECGKSMADPVLLYEHAGSTLFGVHDFGYWDESTDDYVETDHCVVCGYPKPAQCKHEHTEIDRVSVDEEKYEYVDEKVHRVSGMYEDETYCLDCDEYISTSKSYSYSYTEAHFECDDGVCVCGTSFVCKHEKTEIGWTAGDLFEEFYVNAGNSSTHQTHIGNAYEYCVGCGKLIRDDLADYIFDEPHEFLNGSETCVLCGYSKSGSMKPAIAYPAELTMVVGEKRTEKASSKLDKAFSYKSSNKKIVEVSNKGKLTAKKAGTATITITGKQSKLTATCIVTVLPKPKSIKIVPPETTNLIVGDTLQLNYELSPANAKTTVKWRTSPNTVAVIDKDTGLLRATGAGIAYVTASTSNKKESKNLKITVTDPYLPTSVLLDKTGEVMLNLGETLTLHASLEPETAQSEIDWLTSRKEIATVQGGVVTPLREGTTKITARTKKKTPKGNYMTASVNVTVNDPTRPTGVTIDQVGPLTIYTGETRQLTCSLTPKIAVSDIKWTSSNSKIAKVTEDGVLQPKKNGTVTIKAEAKRADKKKGSVVAKIKVTVKKQKIPARIYLSKSDIPFGVYDKGDLLKVGGVAISNHDITELHIDIYKGNTKDTVRSFTAEPWACEYDISAANASLDLMSLDDGCYRIKITALSNGETTTLCDTEFQYGDRADELTPERRKKLKEFVSNQENRNIFTFAYADYIIKSESALDSTVRKVDDIFKNMSLFNLIEAGFIYKGQSKDLIELYEKEIITFVDSGAFDGVSFMDELKDKTQYQLEFLKQGGKLAELLPDGNLKMFVTSADKLLKAVHKGIKEQTKWETTCQRVASITANMENGLMILDYIGESANYASAKEFSTALKNVKTEYAHECAVEFDEVAKRIYNAGAKKIEKEFDEFMDDLWEFAGNKMTLTNGLGSLTGRTLMHIYGLDDLSSAWNKFYAQLDMLYVTVDAYQAAFDKVYVGNYSDALLKKLYVTGGLAKKAWHQLHETIFNMEMKYYVITEPPIEHEVFGTHPEWGNQAIGNHALSEWNSSKFQDLPFYNPDEES